MRTFRFEPLISYIIFIILSAWIRVRAKSYAEHRNVMFICICGVCALIDGTNSEQKKTFIIIINYSWFCTIFSFAEWVITHSGRVYSGRKCWLHWPIQDRKMLRQLFFFWSDVHVCGGWIHEKLSWLVNISSYFRCLGPVFSGKCAGSFRVFGILLFWKCSNRRVLNKSKMLVCTQ